MDDRSGVAALELSDVVKYFPDTAVLAVDHAAFSVFPGEIHALVGENGAGKTTLARIMAGLCQPDSGDMKVLGNRARFRNAHDAHARGVSMLQQSDTLALNLSAAENMALGFEPRFFPGLYDRAKASRNFSKEIAAFGASIDPDIRVSLLGPVERRYVSLARALSRGKSVLILDEPTSILSEEEARRFFASLDALKMRGLAIILISHRMAEVATAADRVTVMRDGRMALTVEGGRIQEYELAHMAANMSDAMAAKGESAGNAGAVIFETRGLSIRDGHDSTLLNDISFTVKSGQIVGIAAIAGNGLDLLERVVSGEKVFFEGDALLEGKALGSYSRTALRSSLLAYIPTERDLKGLCLDEALPYSLIARVAYTISPGEFRHPQSLVELAKKIQAVFPSLSGIEVQPRSLSGGNRQRAVAARELSGNSCFVLAANPSQGLDPAAEQDMRKALLEAARRGAAVLLLGSRLEEIISLSDRIHVLYRGTLSAGFNKPFDKAILAACMAGVP